MMTKIKFLLELHDRLSKLPQEEVEERLGFYTEMIEDRMEEGFSEEEAVAAVGSVEQIAAQIEADINAGKASKAGSKMKRKMKGWQIALLAAGSPIWISLLIAAFAVVLSVYVVLWSVIVSLWAVFGSLIGCSVGGAVAGILFACNGHTLTGIVVIGAGLVCGGLSVFMFCGCKGATKGLVILTKKLPGWIKDCFTGKEEA